MTSREGRCHVEAFRLIEQIRDRIRVKHYSIRTEDSYLQWIRRFIAFHGMRDPLELGRRRSRRSLPISP